MNVPKLRFKEFDGEWDNCKIGDHVKESRILGSKGNRAKKISVKRWGKGVVEKHTIQDGSDNTQYYIRKKGQFIYGKFDFLLGALGVVPEELDGYESTLDSPAFDLSSKLNVSFLDFYTQRKEFYLHYGNIANGSRKARRVHAEDFYSMPLIMPKLDEQQKIGNFLNILNKKIQLQQQKIDLLQEQKKGFLQKMFPKAGETQPQVRFEGFIKGWIKHTLGDLGSVAMNKRIYKEETSLYGDIPFYKIGTFGGKPDAFISREKYEEYKEKYPYPNKGDLLISASGTIGRVIEYNGEEAYYQDSNIIWLQHDERLDNLFLKQFYNIVQWSGIEGTTIKRLYNKNVLETRINLPSIEEQRKIGRFLSILDNKIQLENQKMKLFQKQKQGFMQQMFI